MKRNRVIQCSTALAAAWAEIDETGPIPITADQAFDAVATGCIDGICYGVGKIVLVDMRTQSELDFQGGPARVASIELKNGSVFTPDHCKKIGKSGESETTLILSPGEGQTLTDTTVFELAGGYNDFILYASSNAGMANPTNILVRDNLLTAAFSRIRNYISSKKVYVAVKPVDDGTVGGLSNTVMLYVP